MNGRTFTIFTFGCKVNQYESQLIREEFLRCGFKEKETQAACFIINGCSLTLSSERQCRNLINKLKKEYPNRPVFVTGCYAQNHVELTHNPQDSIYFIPQGIKASIPKLLKKIDCKGNLFFEFGKLGLKKINQTISFFAGHTRAFVKIEDGCNHFCSYCIVPYLRGAVRSKKATTIVREISRLVDNGYKEIVLTGINLGAWGTDWGKNDGLSQLLKNLDNIPNLRRLRLSSIEPLYINQPLLRTISQARTICRHLHIPLQSGDDYVLKMMNRGYRRADYLKKINLARKILGQVSFTTDIMVGFPGEEEAHFENTLGLVREIGFSKIHIFSYSPRLKTKAAEFGNGFNKKTIAQRKQRLQEIERYSSFNFRNPLLKKTVEVLFEQKKDGVWSGHTDTYVPVKVHSGLDLANRILPVTVSRVTRDETWGNLCAQKYCNY